MTSIASLVTTWHKIPKFLNSQDAKECNKKEKVEINERDHKNIKFKMIKVLPQWADLYFFFF